MRAPAVRLTPLTPEERKFAEENYPVLERHIRAERLPEEYTDIAYLGYLHAVKKWHARPELRQWPFSAIVRQAVRSRIGNVRRSEAKQVRTVSLDAGIPGTEGLTYGDTIACGAADGFSNNGGEEGMKIDYDIRIPEAAKLGRTPSVEIETLVNFLGSQHGTMALTYADPKTAGSRAGTLRGWLKKNGRDDVKVYKMDTVVYVEKIKGTKRGAK